MAGFFVLQTLYRAGQFRQVNNDLKGSVLKTYTSMPGPEDMQADHWTGKLYISSCERRTNNKTDNGIYLLDITSAREPVKMQTTLDGEFNPHGLSLFRKDSLLYLFVINHTEKGDKVERFKVTGEILEHENSLSSELMCCPNDLVAISPDKFYVTNDHGSKSGFSRLMEDYLRIPRASILYYDGLDFEVVESMAGYRDALYYITQRRQHQN